ncbi:hypothetical protein QS468_05065 [Bacillus subtilis]|nr:hypothetical protein [Pseudomonas sp. A29(2023)]MDL5592061.1 hypothetical protein [Bacillus subtilis]
MTQKNLVPNGDFGTGDFSHWIPENHNTPMSVEPYNGHYAARLVGGRSQGQNLATKTFRIQPGEFTFNFKIQAPDAYPLQDTKSRQLHISDQDKTSNVLLNAFVTYTLWATKSNSGEEEIWYGAQYVDPQTRTLTLKGTIQPGYERLSIHFAIPNDPFGNKGRYFISDVWFWVL